MLEYDPRQVVDLVATDTETVSALSDFHCQRVFYSKLAHHLAKASSALCKVQII